MQQQEYIEQRLDPQMKWYSKNSAKNKKLYFTFKIIGISIAAIIPFLSGIVGECPNLKYLIGILAVMIAVLEGISLLCKFHEKWVGYRSTSETLKQEKYMFLTQSGIYKGNADAFRAFVERVEFIIAKESSNWTQYVMQTDNKKKDGNG